MSKLRPERGRSGVSQGDVPPAKSAPAGSRVGSGGTKVETFLTERDAGQTHLPSLWSSGSNQMDVSSLRALPAQATSQREGAGTSACAERGKHVCAAYQHRGPGTAPLWVAWTLVKGPH